MHRCGALDHQALAVPLDLPLSSSRLTFGLSWMFLSFLVLPRTPITMSSPSRKQPSGTVWGYPSGPMVVNAIQPGLLSRDSWDS